MALETVGSNPLGHPNFRQLRPLEHADTQKRNCSWFTGRVSPNYANMAAPSLPKGMTPISAHLSNMLARQGVEHLDVVYKLKETWGDIVSGRLATRARPVVITDGCLLVEAATGYDRAILRYQGPSLIKLVNDTFGQGTVVTVKFAIPRDEPTTQQ